MQMTISTKGLPAEAMTRLRQKVGNTEQMHTAIAQAALPALQKKIRANAATNKNRFGARGGFWNRMLSGTLALGTPDAAVLRMPREMNLRVHGGTVEPKKSKYLAIPNIKQAYGKSPRDFDDLRFIPLWGRGGGGALVQREQQKISYGQKGVRKGGQLGGQVFYWLKPSVTVNPNPDLIPKEPELMEAAARGIRYYLRDISEDAI